MKVTIFIPTLNAGSMFRQTLEKIFLQKKIDFEVLIIDSESSDETVSIAKEFQTKIHIINRNDFGHGKTRNLAISLCDSELIVFLSQDAVPYNENWLEQLVELFEDELVAGVYSRQIPKEKATLMDKYFYNHYFGDVKKINIYSKNIKEQTQSMFFSNASSCIRRKILQIHPFNEHIIMSEDQDWAKKILKAKYKTIYNPVSIVLHSHTYNFSQILGRYFDSAHSLKQILGKDFKYMRKDSVIYMCKEFRYIFYKKPKLIPQVLFKNFAKFIGVMCGTHTYLLSQKIKRKLSMHAYYWNKKYND